MRKVQIYFGLSLLTVTGESFSEALIFASTNNPQYDKRLFIELKVQLMKITSSEHVVYINCFRFVWNSEQFMYTTCSELVIFHVLNSQINEQSVVLFWVS